MPKKTGEEKDKMIQKLEYIGINLDKIPEELKKIKPINYRIPKFYEENQYKRYCYIPVKEIQILLSPTHRLDDIENRMKQAKPLADYLDSEKEENIIRYATFLKMLEEVDIEEIEEIEQEQNNLNKKIPFQVKYERNYLWQIYYSEIENQYFMLVPTEDTDYSAFFYLLKKQLENKKTSKIFVPITRVEYTRNYLKKSEFEDIANYMWLFTKDWPSIYEIFDKQGRLSIQIVGETQVYEKITSPYKILLNTQTEANEFYRLLKAMFILQTDLPHYYEFKTDIGKQGELEFYVREEKIEYQYLAEFIKKQYLLGEEQKQKIQERKEEAKQNLENLKITVAAQEIEYIAKEKQISTFLECKKSFFGKFKYYFKYSKKTAKKEGKETINKNHEEEEKKEKEQNQKIQETNKKDNYTIEELIESYQQLELMENELKNIIMDWNALKLKHKNMTKKIENATKFIEEIENHKKSIFEFWKYSNKDEMQALPEGEKEEVNIIKKITKVFDYEQDFEKLGIQLDKMQRQNLTKEETDGVYIATTDLIQILNKVKNNEVTPQEMETNLKELKKQAKEENSILEKEDFDIFGNMIEDSTKIKKINNKKHRELPKDKYTILDINKNTKQIGYKLTIEQIIQAIKKAFEKQVIPEDLAIYKAMGEQKIQQKDWYVFNVNPEKEIEEAIKESKNKMNFYKINIKQGTSGIGFTNCIYFDNQNKTLPIGMDLSSKLLVDIAKMNLELKQKQTFKIATKEKEEDDFSKIIIKTITVFEYDVKED